MTHKTETAAELLPKLYNLGEGYPLDDESPDDFPTYDHPAWVSQCRQLCDALAEHRIRAGGVQTPVMLLSRTTGLDAEPLGEETFTMGEMYVRDADAYVSTGQDMSDLTNNRDAAPGRESALATLGALLGIEAFLRHRADALASAFAKDANG